jgi:predicted membrane protein (TIGR00267 family)
MIRLVIRGLVDGALSSLGVVIGASLSNDLQVILSAGFSGAVANGFSNVLAAFTAEKAGQYKSLGEVEKKMLRSLKGTDREKGISRGVVKGGALDGAFSLLGGIAPIAPFFFLPMDSAVYAAVLLVTLIAVFLGAYTARLSKESFFFGILKMIVFTLGVAGICALIQLVI